MASEIASKGASLFVPFICVLGCTPPSPHLEQHSVETPPPVTFSNVGVETSLHGHPILETDGLDEYIGTWGLAGWRCGLKDGRYLEEALNSNHPVGRSAEYRSGFLVKDAFYRKYAREHQLYDKYPVDREKRNALIQKAIAELDK